MIRFKDNTTVSEGQVPTTCYKKVAESFLAPYIKRKAFYRAGAGWHRTLCSAGKVWIETQSITEIEMQMGGCIATVSKLKHSLLECRAGSQAWEANKTYRTQETRGIYRTQEVHRIYRTQEAHGIYRKLMECIGFGKLMEFTGLRKLVELAGLRKLVEFIGLRKFTELTGLRKLVDLTRLKKLIKLTGLGGVQGTFQAEETQKVTGFTRVLSRF